MTVREVLVGVSTAGVIAAVLGEVAWLRLGLGRRDVGPLPTVALMALGSLPAAMLLARVDAHVWPTIGSLAPGSAADRLASTTRRSERSRRSWRGTPPATATTASGTARPSAGRRTGCITAARTYDLTLAWRQTWFPLHAARRVPTRRVARRASRPTVIGCAAVSKLWQALVHTSLPVTLTPAGRSARW